MDESTLRIGEDLHSRLHRAEEERLALLEGVRGAFRAQAVVADLLAEAHSTGEALERILAALCDTLEFDLATLWNVTDDGDHLVCGAHRTDGRALRFSAATQVLELARGDGPSGVAWMDEEQVWASDFRGLVNGPRAPLAAIEGLRGVCCVPVVVGGSVRSVLELASYAPRPFEETTSMALTAIAGQLGQFVERELIQERYVALSALLDQQVYGAAETVPCGMAPVEAFAVIEPLAA
jgi:putative methionine-R-sulfoxide reductase with GAF domain